MENLLFIHKGQRLTKRILAAIFIVLAIVLLVFSKRSLLIKDWLEASLFILIGLVNLTRLSGSTQSYIKCENNTLRILWRGWVLETIIPENEIEKIILEKEVVVFNRKGKKPAKILFHETEKEQRIKVYEFLIEYGKQKNLPVERP